MWKKIKNKLKSPLFWTMLFVLNDLIVIFRNGSATKESIFVDLAVFVAASLIIIEIRKEK